MSFQPVYLLVALLWPLDLFAQKTREVLVPFDDLHHLLENNSERVWLPRDEYEKLKARVDEKKKADVPVKALTVSAEYRIDVIGDRAAIDGTLELNVLEEGLHGMDLTHADVSLQQALLDGKGAAIGATGPGKATLFVEGVGHHELKLRALSRLQTTAARQILTFQLPMPGATRLFVTIPGDVEVKSGGAVISRVFDVEAEVTRIELLAQRGPVSLVMSLNSRLKRKDRVVVARSVQIDEVTGAYERLHASVSFDILHRAVSTFSFELPQGFEITEVQSPLLARWAIKDGALDVVLREDTTDPVVLNITGLKTAPDLTAWTMPYLKPLNVVSHSAVVGILSEDRLDVEAVTSSHLIPVDNSVLIQALPESVLNSDPGAARVRPLAAFYSPRGLIDLSARFLRPKARWEVITNLTLIMEDSGLLTEGAFLVVPREEPLFVLNFIAPPGWQVTRVLTGDLQLLPFERYERADRSGRIHVQLPAGRPVDKETRIRFSAARVPEGWFA
ncbi:MAG: hypothetical protein AAF492_10340, partial [Verrucomicrobiota bacterium]